MNFVQEAISYLLTAGNWTGPVGLATRIAEHLQYTALAVGGSALIAVPLGMLIGHTGRGTLLVVGLVNGLRALHLPGEILKESGGMRVGEGDAVEVNHGW